MARLRPSIQARTAFLRAFAPQGAVLDGPDTVRLVQLPYGSIMLRLSRGGASAHLMARFSSSDSGARVYEQVIAQEDRIAARFRIPNLVWDHRHQSVSLHDVGRVDQVGSAAHSRTMAAIEEFCAHIEYLMREHELDSTEERQATPREPSAAAPARVVAPEQCGRTASQPTPTPSPNQPSTQPQRHGAGGYRALVQGLENSAPGRRTATVTRHQRSLLARQAVIARSGGHCENPLCSGPGFQARTSAGEPILEVDHVHDLALGGEDHPANMVALCPNCHAVKTRGENREELRGQLAAVARARHAAALHG